MLAVDLFGTPAVGDVFHGYLDDPAACIVNPCDAAFIKANVVEHIGCCHGSRVTALALGSKVPSQASKASGRRYRLRFAIHHQPGFTGGLDHRFPGPNRRQGAEYSD